MTGARRGRLRAGGPGPPARRALEPVGALSHGAGHGPDDGEPAAAARTGGQRPGLDGRGPRAAAAQPAPARRAAGRLRRHRRRAARRARAAAVPGPRRSPARPPPIIGRDVWNGGRSKPRKAPEYGEVQVAFVHHTVTANDYGPEESAGIVLSICKYHRDTNGWNDLGYNFLVDRYGQVFEGREGGVDAAVIGAQAQGYNRLSTGVAIIGTHGATSRSARPRMQATAQLLGLEDVASRRAHRGPGRGRLGRRERQPLPVRLAGHLRAHQRPPRRRQDRVPGQRALCPAPRAAQPRHRARRARSCSARSWS